MKSRAPAPIRRLSRTVGALRKELADSRERYNKSLQQHEQTLTQVTQQRDDAMAARDRYRDAVAACAHALAIARRGAGDLLAEIDADVQETGWQRIRKSDE